MHSGTVQYATPRFPNLADCYFYHRMELPDIGEVGEEWDLRQNVSTYLGETNFAGKRVLEIGPASGFLTAYMERAGADVVSVDLPVDYGWDIVPRPGMREEFLQQRRRHLERLHNGFWYTHQKLGLKSKVIYGRVQDLPDSVGKFDIAIIAAVLIHCRDAMGVLCRCCELATERVVVSEAVWRKIMAPFPVMALIPTPTNTACDVWWNIPPESVVSMLQIMGFQKTRVLNHQQWQCSTQKAIPVYAAIGERVSSDSANPDRSGSQDFQVQLPIT